MRAEGVNVGLMGVQLYRPFPDAAIVEALKDARCAIVFEKALSYGYKGALTADIKAALYSSPKRPLVHNYILGLGGREIKTQHLYDALNAACRAPESMGDTPVWLGLKL
jgi:pyruvate/2-oxoacid:ferredoxin oxidoreductase alpha subunit